MIFKLRKPGIREKVIGISMIVGVTGMAIMTGIFVVNDYRTGRTTLIETLSVLTKAIGVISTAALAFGDTDNATDYVRGGGDRSTL